MSWFWGPLIDVEMTTEEAEAVVSDMLERLQPPMRVYVKDPRCAERGCSRGCHVWVSVTLGDHSTGKDGSVLTFSSRTKALFRWMIAEYERRKPAAVERKRAQLARWQEACVQAERERRQREEEARKAHERERVANERRLQAAEAAWEDEPKLSWCEQPACARAYPFGVGKCLSCRRPTVEVSAESGVTKAEFLTKFTRETWSRPPSPEAGAHVVKQAKEALDRFVSRYDFVGAGNRILEGLMRPRQLLRPDGVSRMLAESAHTFVALKFDIPDFLTYTMPLRDEQLEARYRGVWAADTFPQAVILAYALGATWKALPPAFDRLVPYFLEMATRQGQLIAQAAAAYKEVLRRVNPEQAQEAAKTQLLAELATQVAGLETLIQRVQHSKHPPSAVAEEVARLQKERTALLDRIRSLSPRPGGPS